MGFGCDAHQSCSAVACGAAEARFLRRRCGPPMLFSLDRSLSASFKVSNREESLEILRNCQRRERRGLEEKRFPKLHAITGGGGGKAPKPRCFIELQHCVPLCSRSLSHIYSRYTRRVAYAQSFHASSPSPDDFCCS